MQATSRASLRLLGSVGEPINPEAWEWYHRVVGEGRCPIVDTWWQTETGGILISPLPGAIDLKPGSATKPFFGVAPEIVDASGAVLEGACEGNLVIADSWPGQARTVFGDHERFVQTYFTAYPGKYFTGDGARRDADAITGSPAASTMCSMSRAIASARRRSRAPSSRMSACRRRRWSAIRTTSRARASGLTSRRCRGRGG